MPRFPGYRDVSAEGQRILAADLRGTGQSFPTSCGSSDLLEPYGADYLYASFGSMMGESYLGRRVYDLLRTSRLSRRRRRERFI